LKISDDERKRIVGTYTYGQQPTNRIEALEERGELRIQRAERVWRRLVRLGPLEYHPSGPPTLSVRESQGAHS